MAGRARDTEHSDRRLCGQTRIASASGSLTADPTSPWSRCKGRLWIGC